MSENINKYKMFKNFMHNELQITKEDIIEWIREAIQEEVKNVVKSAYDKCDINDLIRKNIKGLLEKNDWYQRDKMKDSVYTELAKQVFEKYDFNLFLKK